MPEISKLKIVVLISGSGSNLQTLIDQMIDQSLPIEIAAVISNKADAFGLTRAESAGISTVVLDNKSYPDRESYDAALQEAIDEFNPQLVVLAGFMRILTENFVNHYSGRMLNIHPSLLPHYRGLNTHQRAIDDKAKIHGVSVHFVTPELDGGPIIAQSQVDVKASDNAKSLAARVQKQEHKLYPLVIGWIANGRIKLTDGELFFDNQKLNKPILSD
ncbi:MAG: phosphoribosylglycinamide formyltransferase [Gammaproteobacteria bacterium]|nr:phosphoribosylglycinamide formyltransferase [Gammaproteobacteria bacterium]